MFSGYFRMRMFAMQMKIQHLVPHQMSISKYAYFQRKRKFKILVAPNPHPRRDSTHQLSIEFRRPMGLTVCNIASIA